MFLFKGQRGKCKLNEKGVDWYKCVTSTDLSDEIFEYEIVQSVEWNPHNDTIVEDVVVQLTRMNINAMNYPFQFRVNPLTFEDYWIEVE